MALLDLHTITHSRFSLRNRLFLLTTAVEVEASGSVQDKQRESRLVLVRYGPCVYAMGVYGAHLRRT